MDGGRRLREVLHRAVCAVPFAIWRWQGSQHPPGGDLESGYRVISAEDVEEEAESEQQRRLLRVGMLFSTMCACLMELV